MSRATPSAASASDTEAADRVLDRHIEALGGRETLSNITSRHCEGTLERHGRAVPIVTYGRSPNRLRVETRFPRPGTLVQGFDGGVAWVQHPLQGTRRLAEAETSPFAAQAWLHPALHVREMFPVRLVKGTETREGAEVVVLAMRRDGGSLETWRFDAVSARLLEIERREHLGPHGDVPVVVRFEDHRTVDGALIPFVVRTRLPLVETVLRLERVRHNVELDDTLFAAPAEAAAR